MNNLKELKIEVIKKCPLNCLHCSTGSNYSKTNVIEYLKIKDICNTARALGLNKISISGGEPLLHNDLLNILRYINNLGIDFSIYTTGCTDINMQNAMDSSYAKDLYTNGLKKAIFCIHGFDQKSHEYYTRTINSFNYTVTAIEELTRLGVECEFHFVPLKSNYRYLKEIYNLAKQLRIKRISLLRFVPQGRGELIKDEVLEKSDNHELIKIIKYLNDNSVQIRLGSPYNILLITNSPCNAAIDRCIIDPIGNVYPCDAFKNIDIQPLDYNIFKRNFSEIWRNSKYLNKIRKEKLNYCEICKNCNEFSKCGSGCFAQKCLYYGKIKNNIKDPLCLCN